MSVRPAITSTQAFRMSGAELRGFGPRSKHFGVAQAELARRAAKHAVAAVQAIPAGRIPAPVEVPVPVPADVRQLLAAADAVLDAAEGFWSAVEAGHVVELDGMPVYVGPKGAAALNSLRELVSA